MTFPTHPKAEISLLADDKMLSTYDRNIKRAIIKLQNHVEMTTKWFDKWRLRINSLKSIAVIFGRKYTTNLTKLKINNVPIDWSNSSKYLGITIGRKLNFSWHIENIVQKANRIRRISYPILFQ